LDQHTLNNPADTPSDRVDSDDSIDDCQLHYDTNLKEDLARAFRAIAIPGTFAAWQELPTIPPTGLHVDGIGKIEMPLHEAQVRLLIDKSHQAPSGRRSEALVDASVCNTWEIDGDQLQFHDPAWHAYLLELTKSAATSLGINVLIRSELKKMLIYERGGSFEPHSKSLVDIEHRNVKTGKNPDVLGTLIICLPSAHTGGEVIVDHNGERKRRDPRGSTDQIGLSMRLDLQPGHPTWADLVGSSANDLQKHLLRKTLKTWLRDTTCSNTQSHLYSALQYQYPETAISLNVLEAEDFVRVQAIRDVTVELPFVIFLALLEKREHGSLDQDGDYDSDSDYQDDCGTHVIDQVLLTRYAVKSLHALDGTTIAKDFDIDMDMCLEEDPFLNTRVAREHYEPNPGNRGPAATHWYRRAALVIVPNGSLAKYLAQCSSGSRYQNNSNTHSVLSYLEQTSLLGSVQKPLLDAISELCKKDSSHYLSPVMMVDILKAALQHSHWVLFHTVGGRHQGNLPISFFDWAKEWLDSLPAADRAEKYRSWIPSLIRSYPYAADRLRVIHRMSDLIVNADIPDEGLSNLWTKELIGECTAPLTPTGEE
ncbi:hypothetical protein PSHT_13380, partial [Puccinia striiformis]